jgi:hypothetical protein
MPVGVVVPGTDMKLIAFKGCRVAGSVDRSCKQGSVSLKLCKPGAEASDKAFTGRISTTILLKMP